MNALLKNLRKAQKNKYIVELEYTRIKRSLVRGAVAGYSADLVLLTNQDDNFYLNGYTLIRLDKITDCRIYGPGTFLFEAQQELKLFPEQVIDLDISDIKTVCSQIHRHSPLVTVFRANLENCCYIGVVTKVQERTFLLYELNPGAKWDEEQRFRFQTISRLDFGGGYENGLWQVARKNLPPPCQDALSKYLWNGR